VWPVSSDHIEQVIESIIGKAVASGEWAGSNHDVQGLAVLQLLVALEIAVVVKGSGRRLWLVYSCDVKSCVCVREPFTNDDFTFE